MQVASEAQGRKVTTTIRYSPINESLDPHRQTEISFRRASPTLHNAEMRDPSPNLAPFAGGKVKTITCMRAFARRAAPLAGLRA